MFYNRVGTPFRPWVLSMLYSLSLSTLDIIYVICVNVNDCVVRL